MNDWQAAAVSLLSAGRYDVMPFHSWAIGATSLRDFWGHRYNRVVSTLLHDAVFKPARQQLGWSAGAAAAASFFVSGLLHAHVVHVAFPHGSPLAALGFFLLNAAACAAEPYAQLDLLPAPLRALFVHSFLLAASPLYLGNFVWAGPEFFRASPASPQPLLRLPLPDVCPSI